MQWILASASPRRKKLLSLLGVDFRVVVAHSSEESSCTTPESIARDLAEQKALAVQQLEPYAQIIAADTIVVLNNEILGKPKNPAENSVYLHRLSGQTHTVITGVAIATPQGLHSTYESTRVCFKLLTPAEIAWYVVSGEGLDKAGGYGIQEKGALMIEGIEGDYFNVVGLPLHRLNVFASSLGLSLLKGQHAG